MTASTAEGTKELLQEGVLRDLLALCLHLRWLPQYALLTSGFGAAEGTKDILEEGVLRELLAAVDLEYLLDRVGMHAAVNWHDTLSLGAQRLPSSVPLLQEMIIRASTSVHAAAQQVLAGWRRACLGQCMAESCRRCCFGSIEMSC